MIDFSIFGTSFIHISFYVGIHLFRAKGINVDKFGSIWSCFDQVMKVLESYTVRKW